MSVARSRILELTKAQCSIFSTTFNPQGLRLGNKILRQRLKGPVLANYYPRKMVSLKELKSAFPDWEFIDPAEVNRLDHLERLHARGKWISKKRKEGKDGKKR